MAVNFLMPNECPTYWVKGQGKMDDNDFLMMVVKGVPFASHVKCFDGEKELCRGRKQAQEDKSLTSTIGLPLEFSRWTAWPYMAFPLHSVHFLTHHIVWRNNLKNSYTTVWWNIFYFFHFSYKVWVKSTAVCLDVTNVEKGQFSKSWLSLRDSFSAGFLFSYGKRTGEIK